MSHRGSSVQSHLTLILSAILHAFTHAYGTMLVPLYLLIRDDLRLKNVSSVSLLVTIYGFVYVLGSYGSGVLADRFNRKAMLGIGLLGNALAIVAMGLTRRYEMLIVLSVLAGVFGTLFHPAANALAPAHFPKSPGMAIGVLGIGSGLGFFAGPQYAGWRAQTATWQWGSVAQWQKPCIELGILGTVVGVLFLLIAKEARGKTDDESEIHPPLGTELRWRIIRIAAVLMMRDFAGIAAISLLSLYLQKALGYDVKHAGFVIGVVMLLSVVANPISVWLSPGKRRLPMLAAALVIGAIFIILVPLMPSRQLVALTCAFMTCQLGTYAISDAAILERVPPEVRGRVVGLFLTVAGPFAALAPFFMGFWVDLLKGKSTQPHAYIPIFASIGAMLALAVFSTPLIARLGHVQGPRIEPITETGPRTMEVVG